MKEKAGRDTLIKFTRCLLMFSIPGIAKVRVQADASKNDPVIRYIPAYTSSGRGYEAPAMGPVSPAPDLILEKFPSMKGGHVNAHGLTGGASSGVMSYAYDRYVPDRGSLRHGCGG